MDRRKFLKVAGVGALGLAGLPASRLFAAGDPRFKPPAEGLQGKRWAMVIDLTQEAHDAAAISMCHKIHNVPEHENPRHEIKWIWNTEFKHAFPGLASDQMAVQYKKEHSALVLCNHCENPPCVRVCPTQATFKRDDGIVLMDFHRCIGCRFCMAACPYGARSFNWVDPRKAANLDEPEEIVLTFPTRMKGVVEKCNFCAERLARGLIPACVENSTDGRMLFGDLDDPKSDVSKVVKSKYTIRRKLHLGTGPSVFYIV
jgi:molybdopterin-containing oxidoreductase family iron-sulfur binding subunit